MYFCSVYTMCMCVYLCVFELIHKYSSKGLPLLTFLCLDDPVPGNDLILLGPMTSFFSSWKYILWGTVCILSLIPFSCCYDWLKISHKIALSLLGRFWCWFIQGNIILKQTTRWSGHKSYILIPYQTFSEPKRVFQVLKTMMISNSSFQRFKDKRIWDICF